MKQHLKRLLDALVGPPPARPAPADTPQVCPEPPVAAPPPVPAAPPIPTIALSDIVGEREPTITLPIGRYEDGMLPLKHATALLAILVAEQPAEVLEIGTFMGHTTRAMAENLENAIIHTVDLPREYSAESDTAPQFPKDDFHLIRRRVIGREFKDRPCASRILQHFADTALWDFREAGNPTFFFIDGSHTYEYCRNDSEKCLALCGGRGVFLWHDYDNTHPGVEKFLREWLALGRNISKIAGTTLAYWKSTT
jgi:hypothetical protein